MERMQIDILNPKAKKLLRSLDEMNLIKINKTKDKSDFLALKKIRARSSDEISHDEITNEVEQVRSLRYEK
jgi:hypothetical protein